MSLTYFVSDIHLSPSRNDITQAFLSFLKETAPTADKLYVLGDLFEMWVGDDDLSRFNRSIIEAFKALADNGTELFYIHGNRDFLIGQQFAKLSGMTILPEQSVIELYGKKVLLCHGDELCTLDVGYQQYRTKVRTKEWQQNILKKPLFIRRLIGKYIRFKSRQQYKNKTMEIMDVTPEAVEEIMLKHGVTQLIHGHTHRPAEHSMTVNGQPAKRIVLGDWYSQSSILKATTDSITLESSSL